MRAKSGIYSTEVESILILSSKTRCKTRAEMCSSHGIFNVRHAFHFCSIILSAKINNSFRPSNCYVIATSSIFSSVFSETSGNAFYFQCGPHAVDLRSAMKIDRPLIRVNEESRNYSGSKLIHTTRNKRKLGPEFLARFSS